MLRFTEYTDIENYIESLLEYTISTKDKGSYATWGSKKFPPPSWVVNGFAAAEISLSDTTVFQIADGKPEDFEDNYIIGTSKEAKDIIAYTDVYDDIEGKLLGKVAWTQNPQSYFKGLESGTDIKWGSNTDAVETAACMGVYLDADSVLADEKKDTAKAREKWNPIIKGVLKSGYDWDSGGVSKLVSKMDDMSDVNWRTMILIAKGMQNFISQEGKNIGTTYHIIHGSIRDYYTAEENNPAIETTGEAKTNTADMILANVPAKDVIKAMADQVVEYDDTDYYCHASNKSVKFYQISLKKSMSGAQLGKLTAAVKALYKVGQNSTTLWKSLMGEYLIRQGYEVSQLDEGWFSDKLSQGLTAIKSFATTWYKKIVGLFNKIKEIGKALVSGYDKNLPSGRPNNFQKSLITSIFNESKNLSHGEFLTEAKAQTEKTINDYLRNATSEEAVLLLTHVNGQLKTIEDFQKENDIEVVDKDSEYPYLIKSLYHHLINSCEYLEKDNKDFINWINENPYNWKDNQEGRCAGSMYDVEEYMSLTYEDNIRTEYTFNYENSLSQDIQFMTVGDTYHCDTYYGYTYCAPPLRAARSALWTRGQRCGSRRAR